MILQKKTEGKSDGEEERREDTRVSRPLSKRSDGISRKGHRWAFHVQDKAGRAQGPSPWAEGRAGGEPTAGRTSPAPPARSGRVAGWASPVRSSKPTGSGGPHAPAKPRIGVSGPLHLRSRAAVQLTCQSRHPRGLFYCTYSLMDYTAWSQNQN